MDAGEEQRPAQRSVLPLLLRDLHDAMGEANIAMARRLTMHTTDASAIEHISLASHPIGPAELSTRLGVTRSTATEIVDRLVAAGHLQRERDESDGRRFRLVPSEAARRRVGTEIAPLLAAIDDATSDVGDAERQVIADFLTAVTRAHRRFAGDDDATTT